MIKDRIVEQYNASGAPPQNNADNLELTIPGPDNQPMGLNGEFTLMELGLQNGAQLGVQQKDNTTPFHFTGGKDFIDIQDKDDRKLVFTGQNPFKDSGVEVTNFNSMFAHIGCKLILPLIICLVIIIIILAGDLSAKGPEWIAPVKRDMVAEDEQALRVLAFQKAQAMGYTFQGGANSLKQMEQFVFDLVNDKNITIRSNGGDTGHPI